MKSPFGHQMVPFNYITIKTQASSKSKQTIIKKVKGVARCNMKTCWCTQNDIFVCKKCFQNCCFESIFAYKKYISESNFLKNLKVYFLYSRKGGSKYHYCAYWKLILKAITTIEDKLFERYLYLSKRTFHKILFWLIEWSFRKQKLQMAKSIFRSAFCILWNGCSKNTIFLIKKSVP